MDESAVVDVKPIAARAATTAVGDDAVGVTVHVVGVGDGHVQQDWAAEL